MKMRKILESLILFAAAFILFSSCVEDQNPLGGVDHYFEGLVVDEEGNGIPGIKVTSNYGYTKTNQEGKFALLAYSKGTSGYSFTFEDVDGDENGGLFQTETYSSHSSNYNICVTLYKITD